MINEREFLSEKRAADSLDLRRIAGAVWHIKFWILLSVVLCLAGGWFFIRYSTPVYRREISVVVNDHGNRYDNSFQLISSTFGMSGGPQIDNQLFLLRSTRVMRGVVERAMLNVRYFSVGRFVETEYYTSSPVVFTFVPAEGFENVWIDMTIVFDGSRKVTVESILVNGTPVGSHPSRVALDDTFDIPVGRINFALRTGFDLSKQRGTWRITRSDEEHTARTLASKLAVTAASRGQNIMTVSLEDQHPGRAEDVLNLLMEEYNILAKSYDSQNILNTISFLDERIAGLENELRAAEGTFTSYRSANELVDVASQSQMAMSSDAGYRERLDELALQDSFLGIVKKSLADDGVHKMIPANIGISDVGLNTMIGQYNGLVIDRDRMLAGSSPANPRVQDAEVLLNTLKANLMQSVNNLQTAYNLQRQSFDRRLGSSQRELAAMPIKQLALTRMSRNQQVKEPLYILLQQKREEALLMLSSLSDGAYVVDNARGPAAPVFPDRKKIFSGLLLAAIAVPVGFVTLVNIFRTRIRFEKDIVDRTDIPVLGVIPRAARVRRSPTKTGLVSSAGRDPLTESFRILRSKFQYLNIDKKKPGALILQVTSSGPREGKSFVSVNMALSLAWLGKKVLLVGADLRKPAIGRYLRLPPVTEGLSNYLSGTIEDVHRIITRHEGTPAFDIIRTGAIPFNPGELLGGPLLGEALESLRAEYDYIIVDSAPFLVVSDSFTISKSVDSVLYVVRSGHTRLNIADRLQNMMREGSLPSVMIVLNGVDFKKNMIYGGGRRGSGYGYGYGYGYGWGHGARYGYVSKK